MKTARIVLITMALGIYSGCAANVWHPVRFSTTEEAFASLKPADQIPPPDSVKKGVFRAPFEDVWRAASISASQAQLNVEIENKAKGVIFATRTIQAAPFPTVPTCQFSQPYNGVPQQRNYYYAIVLKEQEAKSTEVTVLALAQGRCITGACAGFVDGEECRKYSSIHWATGLENSMTELNQVLIFIRNNLIAAGSM